MQFRFEFFIRGPRYDRAWGLLASGLGRGEGRSFDHSSSFDSFLYLVFHFQLADYLRSFCRKCSFSHKIFLFSELYFHYLFSTSFFRHSYPVEQLDCSESAVKCECHTMPPSIYMYECMYLQ